MPSIRICSPGYVLLLHPRIDQGERQFTFWFNAGPADERMARVEREALAHNEKPMALSFYPSGTGTLPGTGVTLSDDCVVLTAFKRAENGAGYVLSLFEPPGIARKTTVAIPALGIEKEIPLNPFEIKSLLLVPEKGSLVEVDLLERPAPAIRP